MNIPRVIICGTGSGCGKTTVSCAILKALKDRGFSVTAAKCGPDYIDPMFHGKTLGVPSMNLDMFFTEAGTAKSMLFEHAKNSDICLIEGVMGYYDGLGIDTDKASTYDVSISTGTPSVLVINAKGSALTAASVINGINDFRRPSNINAVILNNISESVYKSLKPMIERETCLKVIGYMPHDNENSFESRHLGLKIPKDEILFKIEKLGQIAESTIDIKALLKIASSAVEINDISSDIRYVGSVKIAVARDEAFAFYYNENLSLLKKMGAEIVFFSPIKDDKLPKDADGLILGGGYPELYAEKLSENKSMINDIKNKLNNGMPCLAECGGYMYLCGSLEDEYRESYHMAGFINTEAFKTEKLTRFGYVILSSEHNYIDGIKGHEFHYWDTNNNGSACTAYKPSWKKSWPCIHICKNTIAGFPHLYYHSKPEFAEEFIKKCISWRD